jgi:cell division protein FtsI (penicillin-binding protein 3)
MNEGLERAYNNQLAGKNGIREVLSDARQNNLAIGGNILKPPSPGADLMLTIDENIQFLVENELQYAMNKHRPDGITCIVMKPESGEILAMANLPDFDPEHYGSTPKNRLISRRNRAVEFQYEPASAFKIVTISSALERGLISLDNKVYCENGGIKVFNRTIKDHKPFGSLTYREVLWYSSNVGAIKAALKMTPEQFHESIEKFGFGEKTGIDLPAEINGHFRPAREWERTSPCFLAMGHEIGATPLQMLGAANVIANGGFLVQPRVGKKLIYENGNIKLLTENHPPRRILSSKTVSLMKEALRGVVEKGTGRKAAIAGVHVFGKTGTAQRLTQKGYSKKDYNASFVGFFPAEKPRYAMIVVVYNPHRGGVHGGEVAAPIFSRIGEGIIWYERSRNKTPQSEVLNVPSVVQHSQKEPTLRIKIATEPPVSRGKMPNVIGLGIKSALKKCTQAGIFPQVKGAGWVVSQNPEPQAFPKSSGNCWIELKGG